MMPNQVIADIRIAEYERGVRIGMLVGPSERWVECGRAIPFSELNNS